MKRIFDMKQERATLVASIRSTMDEYDNKDMPDDKKEELARMEASFDDLNSRIISEERQLERERQAGEIADENAANPVAANQMKLFAAALSGNPHRIEEYKASFTLGDDDQAGSLTAPVEFRQQLIKGLDDALFMRSIATVLPTLGAGQTLGYPYRKTAATDFEWKGEIDEAGEETALEYGRREFKPNRMAKEIKISRTLMNHAPMAPRVLQDEMVYHIGSTAENAYMTGDGTGKPLGLFVPSANGISTGRDVADGNTATGVTYDGLINAKYSLKQQYWRNAQWIMHRNLIRDLAKVKDTDGQYIWQPSVADSVPDRLLGHAVNMSEFAPNTYTAGQYAAIFGDFKYYWIVDTDVVTIQVLKELYAKTNQIGYLYDYSGDGAPVLEEAFARVQLGA